MGLLYTALVSAGITNPPGSAEATLVATPNLIADNAGPNNPVTIEGVIALTAGTGVTSVSVRIRQGPTTGGVQIGPTAAVTLAAGNSAIIPFQVTDATTYLNAASPYSVNVVCTGATGATTITYVAVQVSD